MEKMKIKNGHSMLLTSPSFGKIWGLLTIEAWTDNAKNSSARQGILRENGRSTCFICIETSMFRDNCDAIGSSRLLLGSRKAVIVAGIWISNRYYWDTGYIWD